MAKPLVSICVPTANRASYLRESLRSIRAQDYEPLEILISDNCSDDDTEAICRKAAAEDSRIRYVRHTRPLSLYGNHNYCIEASRGELLGFFHDDDDRAPEMVRTYVDFLTAHPEVGVVSSDWDLIDDDGRWIGARDHRVAAVTSGLTYIERTVRSGRSSVGCPGAMIRRSALGDVRFDEEGAIGFGDFVVWFRIAERFAIGHVNQRLWKYRIHRKSLSRRTIESLSHDYETNLNRYFEGHLARWPGHASLVRRWRTLGRHLLFWALLYEVSLHCRRTASGLTSSSLPQTIFEHSDQRLTDEELGRALSRAREVASGPVQTAALAGVGALTATGFTWPLAFMTGHVTTLRKVLRLR
jgi:glycosyltransferase involved in cell wall biosynthesis